MRRQLLYLVTPGILLIVQKHDTRAGYLVTVHEDSIIGCEVRRTQSKKHGKATKGPVYFEHRQFMIQLFLDTLEYYNLFTTLNQKEGLKIFHNHILPWYREASKNTWRDI